MAKLLTRQRHAVFALILALGSSVFAQAPIPKALAEARTVFLVSDGASQAMLDGLARDLTAWGRYTVVDDPAVADLTFTLGGLQAFRGWPLTITKDRVTLWEHKAKRGLTTNVTESLVKSLRQFLERDR